MLGAILERSGCGVDDPVVEWPIRLWSGPVAPPLWCGWWLGAPPPLFLQCLWKAESYEEHKCVASVFFWRIAMYPHPVRSRDGFSHQNSAVLLFRMCSSALLFLSSSAPLLFFSSGHPDRDPALIQTTLPMGEGSMGRGARIM